MNRKEKSWEKRRHSERKIDKRLPIEKILIVCEGGKTEPNYFWGFTKDKNKLEVIGLGCTPDRLVEEAIRKKQDALDKNIPFNQVWCVFDRNSFEAQKFNRALQIASNNKIKVAYTNEAFELWYLLHFNYYDSAMSRNQYKEKLCELLPFRYEKTDECSKKMYDELLDRQSVAIRYAEMLFNHHLEAKGRINPEEDNPSTTVHRLVEELNKMLS
jgi:hypothetical protein